LESGIHEFTYYPLKDLRNLFTMNTRLSELAKNKKALEILQRIIPMAVNFISHGDADGMSHSLNMLKKMDFFGISAEDIEKAAEEILLIKQ
jgi:alpha-L-rhamnosidase